MDDDNEDEIVEQTAEYVSITLGLAQWVNADEMFFLEEDFNVKGEIWRVHKSDPDPLPSDPHAHCIAGSRRFVGCKLHLGTRELYDGKNKPLGRYLYKKQFDRLIELIRSKFPEITLPLKA
jgi:hypothetical protein